MEKLALSECIHSIVDSWRNGNLFIHFHFFINNTQVSITSPSSFFLFWPCSLRDLSSWTRDWTPALGSESWSPNHWTIREFPAELILSPSVCFINLGFLHIFSLFLSFPDHNLYVLLYIYLSESKVKQSPPHLLKTRVFTWTSSPNSKIVFFDFRNSFIPVCI